MGAKVSYSTELATHSAFSIYNNLLLKMEVSWEQRPNAKLCAGKKKGICPQNRGIRHRCLNGTIKLHAFVQLSIICEQLM